jgi:hypothetical protein
MPLAAILAHSDEGNRCSEAPKVIEPARSGPKLEALTNWLKNNATELDRKFTDPSTSWQTLESSAREASLSVAAFVASRGVYLVDANNDGIDEYIVTGIGGSGSYLTMWIFDKTPSGFRLKETDDPPKPKNITSDGPWYLRAATDPFNTDSDPLAGYGELFVRVCGKVYLTFSGWATGPSREAYIWENGATSEACNREWIDYSRNIFQQLYKANRYAEAVRFMQGPLDQCGNRIDAKQRAWSYNDLALADFRLDDRQSCLDDVSRAKSQMPASALGPGLEKAIAYNESLCKSGQMPEKADFAEFFKDAGRSDQSRAWREEFENQILPAIVPDVEDDSSAQPHTLREMIELQIDGARPEIVSGHYLILADRIEGGLEDKAMVWIDAQRAIGAFATTNPGPISSPDATSTTACEYTVGSRNLTKNQIPKEFWDSFQTWRMKYAPPKSSATNCIDFIGTDAKVEPVSPPQ